MAPMTALRCSLKLAAGFWLAACTGGDRASRDSAVTARDTTAASQSAGKATQHDFAQIVKQAQSADYSYEATPRDPVPARNPTDITHNGVAQAAAPTTLTIAAATRSSTPTPLTEEVLARIDSDRAYPELGILPDANFIWRYRADPDPAKWEVWVIPQRAPGNAKLLVRSATDFSNGNHTQPRLVRAEKVLAAAVAIAFGTCLEDPVCPSGHCGYQ